MNDRKLDPAIPVYHGKMADVVAKIKVLLKDYQHSLVVTQREENGAVTACEVTITLKK